MRLVAKSLKRRNCVSKCVSINGGNRYVKRIRFLLVTCNRKSYLLIGKGVTRAVEVTIRPGPTSTGRSQEHDFPIPAHILINFEMKIYYQRRRRFNGVYSRNDFPKIRDVTYIINRDEYKSI